MENRRLLAAGTCDFGDAPLIYPVLLSDDGARHIATSLTLGNAIDVEADGKPSPQSDGDGSDDDGVVAISEIVSINGTSTTASFQITASGPARLDAWIDFNQDGDWNDDGEQIATSLPVVAGGNTLSFAVSSVAVSSDAVASVAVAGESAARFRLSSAGSLAPTGAAVDGEVEDYPVVIVDGAAATQVSVELFDVFAVIVKDETQTKVRSNRIDLFAAANDRFGQLRVVGIPDSDALFIDFSGGDVVPSAGLVIDGAGGSNELRLTNGDGGFDFTDGSVIASNYARIELGIDHFNTITVNAAAIETLAPASKRVSVIGRGNDAIVFADAADWRMGDTSVVNGAFFREVTHAASGSVIDADFDHGWQNIVSASDVNNDGDVTAGDALLIVNELGRRSFSQPDGSLEDPINIASFPGIYFDQNGDDRVTALDALRIINELSRVDTASRAAGFAMASGEWLPRQARKEPDIHEIDQVLVDLIV